MTSAGSSRGVPDERQGRTPGLGAREDRSPSDEDPDSRAIEGMARLFAAMGDPSRLRILLRLARGERCVSELADLLGISWPAVSQHLGLLRRLKLVRSRRDGRHVYYALDDHHVQRLLEVSLEHVRLG